MNGRGTIFLTVVLAGMLLAYWLTGTIKTRSDEREALLRRAFEFSDSDVVRLSVERAGEQPVSGAREASGSWSIVDPHPHVPANNIVWNRLADAVSRLAFERIIDEDPRRLAPYEMEPPHLRVEFETAGGESGVIVGGAVDPTQEFRYFRVDEGPIGLTPVAFFHELNRSLLDLRQRYLVAPSEEGITRLEYAKVYTGGLEPRPDRTYIPEPGEESVRVVVQRNEAGRWDMLAPVEAPGHEGRIVALVNELQYMVGRGYIDSPGELSLYGLDPPEHRLTVVWGPQGTGRTLEFGWAAEEDTKAGIYVKFQDSASVFVIDGHLLTMLPETPDAFRQTRLLAGEAVDLVKIRYSDEYSPFTLETDAEGAWVLSDPPHDDMNQNAVSSYIAFLKSAGGLSFPEAPENTGLDSPRISLELTYGSGRSSSILVGDPVPDTEPAQYFAQQEDGAITTLPLEVLLTMRATPFRFRDHHLMAFARDRAKEIRIRFEDTQYVLEKVGPRWAVTEPSGMVLESQADARALLETISTLQATGVADPAPGPEATGFDRPLVQVSVHLADTEDSDGAVGPIEVGSMKAASSRERFARVAGREEVVFVDQDFVDELRAALRGVMAR